MEILTKGSNVNFSSVASKQSQLDVSIIVEKCFFLFLFGKVGVLKIVLLHSRDTGKRVLANKLVLQQRL